MNVTGPLKMEYYGSPLLRQPCDPVTVFDPGLREFTAHMAEILYEQNGVGLAAPQVGIPRRLVIVDLSFGEEVDKILVLVNPEILSSEGECSIEEGCLSIPGVYENVVRPEQVRVRFQDIDGATVELDADGPLARVIQHERDHLDGILFVDRLGALKRTFLAKTLRDMSKKNNG